MKLTDWLKQHGGSVSGEYGHMEIVAHPDVPPDTFYIIPDSQQICEKCLTTYPGGPEFEHDCPAVSSKAGQE